MIKKVSHDNVNEKEIKKAKKENSRKIMLIFDISLVILWMLVVFLFSNQNSTNSTNTSTVAIKAILKIFNINDNQNNILLIENLQNITRKSAHFILYTVGGFLIYNLFHFLKKNSVIYIKNKKIEEYISKNDVIISILFGTIYAMSDEIHQYFILGRSCELRDVCIDTLGIILGVVIYMLSSKVTKKENKNI